MLWEVDIYPAEGQPDITAAQVATAAADLNLGRTLRVAAARGFLVQGSFDRAQIEQLARRLLFDPVVERAVVAPVGDAALNQLPWTVVRGNSVADPRSATELPPTERGSATELPPTVNDGPALVHVLSKPGVMDPVAQSAMAAIGDLCRSGLGGQAEAVRTMKKYWVGGLDGGQIGTLAAKVLANDAIEQVIVGPLAFDKLELGSPYRFQLVTVPLRAMDDAALEKLSREGQLYLSLVEMQTIQAHFQKLGRDPTDIELETVAQTWSEHCSHKTLAGRIRYRDENGERRFDNMLRETIFAATQQIRQQLGDDDWCVSVFSDNAGVIRFDDEYNVCFKVETHNHPSALEPYGGANTGIGGVIRDPMGTGMGAKPICNTDVFCFAPPDTPADALPPGVLHPRRVMRGVVSGVRDYGNRMGIPTVNGAIYFDPRYLGNPLVYCGNVGLIPRDKSFKHPHAGDLIVALGGRTGRDGIHGATFSSAELTSHSETLSGGAVQIGNAITEKMLLDVVLAARDRGLYSAITDCGAGGFSSAVGEMGEKIGAEVWLEKAPLKYDGLSYTEIWISEAQERMVLSVPDVKWPELAELCRSEGVEATIIGRFMPTGKLKLTYQGHQVGELSMEFLHDGRPPVVREAVYEPKEGSGFRVQGSGLATGSPRPQTKGANDAAETKTSDPLSSVGEGPGVRVGSTANRAATSSPPTDYATSLQEILASLNVCSKEWVIRQYDHEVQGGSVVKPLVGVKNDGPGDAAVLRPVLTSRRGIAISCGMNPRYGDLDPYWMAASAIDEALRNCVAVGANPARTAILDNFCWGTTDRPETLGSLVRAALACHDMAVALGTPFISGKDSLNNEFRPLGAKEPISIPPSLLISAIGMVEDVSRCVTMDLKRPGNRLFFVGLTKNELGGSHFELVNGIDGGAVPQVDAAVAKRTFAALHEAISRGLVRACHDLSEGGLAVAAAEMAFAGGLGVKIELDNVPHADDATDPVVLLFSESNTRLLCEITPENTAAFAAALSGVPCAAIGEVTADDQVEFTCGGQTLLKHSIVALKEAWQTPLCW